MFYCSGLRPFRDVVHDDCSAVGKGPFRFPHRRPRHPARLPLPTRGAARFHVSRRWVSFRLARRWREWRRRPGRREERFGRSMTAWMLRQCGGGGESGAGDCDGSGDARCPGSCPPGSHGSRDDRAAPGDPARGRDRCRGPAGPGSRARASCPPRGRRARRGRRRRRARRPRRTGAPTRKVYRGADGRIDGSCALRSTGGRLFSPCRGTVRCRRTGPSWIGPSSE